MSSTDELREVEVQIKGNEYEAQHGHQMSMGDRDPTSMNDHVKVRRKTAMLMYICIQSSKFRETKVKALKKNVNETLANDSTPCKQPFDCFRLNDQGLKITEENVLCYYICKWLDVQVFSDKDHKP